MRGLPLRFLVAFLLAGAALSAKEPGSVLAEDPPESLTPATMIEGLACRTDPSQTYTLYLPAGYSPDRSWPALLIFDPRGRSTRAAELFRRAADEYGWVLVSSNDTRSDGPMEPNLKALNALWPEVHELYSIDHRRIYATGFSGGATVAWLLARTTSKVAGVIHVGGPYLPQVFAESPQTPFFGLVGSYDPNFSELRRIEGELASQGVTHRSHVFEGPHRWMPEEEGRQAVGWMELEAMKRDSRPRDDRLVAGLFAEDVALAAGLEDKGDALAASRRLKVIGLTFEGLIDEAKIAALRDRAERLRATPEAAAALAEEEKWDAYEAAYLKRWSRMASEVRGAAERQKPVRRLIADLKIEELKARAGEPSYAGLTAKRLLEAVYTTSSFYLTRSFLAAELWAPAASVLSIAVEIKPERPGAWYNLASALARNGNKRRALEALEKAVEAGFSNRELLESDRDLRSLRQSPEFRQLVSRIGQ